MLDYVYRKLELVGSSKKSVEDAIQNAIDTASKSLQHLDRFEVQEVRGDQGWRRTLLPGDAEGGLPSQ
jgi:flavin-binding protein dodecin